VIGAAAVLVLPENKITLIDAILANLFYYCGGRMYRLTVILYFFLSSLSHAQTEVGLKGGLNISDIVMTNYIDPDVESELNIKAGLHAGVFLNSMIDEKVGVAGELLYSNKGFRANPNINLHYIAVPLLVQYKLTDHIFAEGGPELSYLFSARSRNGNESNIYNNKFDLALDGGFRFDGPKLAFSLRYSAGFFSVRETSQKYGTSGNEKIKFQNRVLQMSVGYKLWAGE
jgi:outer membrane immunogenic protein